MDRLLLTLHNLPSSFENEIVKNNKDFTTIRSNLNNMNDIHKWVKDFGLKTHTHWNVKNSQPQGERFVCWKQFVCHQSAKNKVTITKRKSKYENCKASLRVKIKLNTTHVRHTDPFAKRGLFAVITIENKHSHSLIAKEALRALPATEHVRQRFFEYFKDGMRIAESCHFHKGLLVLKGFTEIELTSGSVNPSQRTVRNWYDQWKKLNSKPRIVEDRGLVEEKNVTQENSALSGNKQREEYMFPAQTDDVKPTLTKIIDHFSDHRSDIETSDAKSSAPELMCVEKEQNNTESNEIHQVTDENTSSSLSMKDTSEAAADDEFAHFGSNVAVQLRSMSLEKALLCQVEITKVLSKYKFESSPSSPNRNTNSKPQTLNIKIEKL